jgi:hypothetical protein
LAGVGVVVTTVAVALVVVQYFLHAPLMVGVVELQCMPVHPQAPGAVVVAVPGMVRLVLLIMEVLVTKGITAGTLAVGRLAVVVVAWGL